MFYIFGLFVYWFRSVVAKIKKMWVVVCKMKKRGPCAGAEDQIARDGLLGLGAVGVGAAVLGGVISAVAAGNRR